MVLRSIETTTSLLLAIFLSLLLLRNSIAFQIPSHTAKDTPCLLPMRHHQQRPCLQRFRGGSMQPLNQSGSATPSDNEKSRKERQNAGLARFLNAFYRGITVPFPTLSRLTLGDTDSKKADASQKTSIGFTLRESILAIVVYLLIGAVSYHLAAFQVPDKGAQIKSWSFVDAIYFSVVTFTTVGYGDMYPTSALGKIFTIMFGLSGISILGLAIGTIGSKIIATESEMIDKAKEKSRRRILGIMSSLGNGHPNDRSKRGDVTENSSSKGTTSVSSATSDTSNKNEQPQWKHTLQTVLSKSVPALSVVVLGGIGMGRLEGWSLLNSIYYAFVTAATLGYGDYSPVTRPGRLWGVIFIPLAVAAAGEVLGNVVTTLRERRQNQFYQSLVKQELNTERLLAMDTDKDGTVSREEYVEFMLQEMELVSKEEFAELHAQFAKLDADGGGFLDKQDIERRIANREQDLSM